MVNFGCKFRQLQAFLLFKNVNEKNLKLLAEQIRFEEFSGQQIIFEKGDIGDKFYIIKDGEVEIFNTHKKDGNDEKEIYTTLGRGEFFGEIALFKNIERTTSVKTLRSTIVFTINRKSFQSVFSNEDSMVERISSRRMKEQTFIKDSFGP